MKRSLRLPLSLLVALLVLLLALHWALPSLVRHYLNQNLAQMGDYRGHISRVELAWWRGAYRIEGLNIVKQQGKIPVPFFKVPGIDLAISWQALWQEQTVVAKVVFEQPELNFVDGNNEQTTQTGQGTDWQAQLDKLLPITLDELRIENGTLRFHNFNSKPAVKLQASAINANVYNLTNVKNHEGKRVAELQGTAQLLDHAPLEVSASFDPFVYFQDFEVRLRANAINLPKLNDLAAAYGNFDFKSGSGTLVIEAAANDGNLSGYIKPLLTNVDIFDWKQDVQNPQKGFFRGLWEAVLGGSETLLKNQRKNLIATRVELHGSVKNTEVSAFQALVGILRNAFIKAFTPRYES